MAIEFGLGIRPLVRRVRNDAADIRERRGRLGLAGAAEVAAREVVQWSVAQRAIADAYHRVYYYNRGRTWKNTHWLGHEIQKLPLDTWIYQEMIHELRPELIVETGTRFGGSALFMAQLIDLIGYDGRLVSIDVAAGAQPEHPRITYLNGSSVHPGIVKDVARMARDASPVMVVLDADHRAAHVRQEIAAYAGLVTLGSYLIVEDSNTGGHPVHHVEVPDGGPMRAVKEFLARDDRFEVDLERERFFVTQNPSGYLRRVREAASQHSSG